MPTTAVPADKLANRIAKELTARINAKGWPVGERLGRESDLLLELGVSREPFREAVRILERQGIVSMERGALGGLRIQAPAIEGVSNMLRSYVEFADIGFYE